MKVIILSLLLLFVYSGDLAAEGKQKYLDSQIEYKFKKPSGSNSPQIHPLENEKLIPYHSEEIFLRDRSQFMKRFPCSECHDAGTSVSKMQKKEPTHEAIKVDHGKIQNCMLCHVDTHMEKVNSLSGPQSLQFAPMLCSTCHAGQYKDWEKGAHGKRVGQWTGKKVYQSCVECHNPHAPKFEKRQPASPPKVNRLK